jgi:hypothetical protein
VICTLSVHTYKARLLYIQPILLLKIFCKQRGNGYYGEEDKEDIKMYHVPNPKKKSD